VFRGDGCVDYGYSSHSNDSQKKNVPKHSAVESYMYKLFQRFSHQSYPIPT
jgi:hypothetical protein